MREDFVLHVVFNVPRHHNQRLPHQKQEKAFEQCHHQNQNPVEQNGLGEDAIHVRLGVEAVVEKIQVDGFLHQIEGVAHHLRGNDPEKIRNKGEENAKDQVILVLDQVFIQVTECLHK